MENDNSENKRLNSILKPASKFNFKPNVPTTRITAQSVSSSVPSDKRDDKPKSARAPRQPRPKPGMSQTGEVSGIFSRGLGSVGSGSGGSGGKTSGSSSGGYSASMSIGRTSVVTASSSSSLYATNNTPSNGRSIDGNNNNDMDIDQFGNDALAPQTIGITLDNDDNVEDVETKLRAASQNSNDDASILFSTQQSPENNQSSSGFLYLFQLPPVLPHFTLSAEDTQRLQQQQQELLLQQQQQQQEKTEDGVSIEQQTPLQLHQLPDSSEGRVGKLVQRKSGKVELWLGDLIFDVTDGTLPQFYQNISLLHKQALPGTTDPAAAGASMSDLYVLGGCRSKFVVQPRLPQPSE